MLPSWKACQVRDRRWLHAQEAACGMLCYTRSRGRAGLATQFCLWEDAVCVVHPRILDIAGIVSSRTTGDMRMTMHTASVPADADPEG